MSIALTGCVEPPTQGHRPADRAPDMQEFVDASPPVELDMDEAPDIPPDAEAEADQDMPGPPEEDMKSPPAPCENACTERFACEQGVCTWQGEGVPTIEVEPFGDGGLISLTPPPTTERRKADGGRAQLGSLTELPEDVLRAAQCPTGTFMVGANLGFGVDTPGQGIMVLREFVPLCRPLGFMSAKAGQPVVALGPTQQSDTTLFAGNQVSPTVTDTIECAPGQILGGIESQSFNYNFFATDLTLYCTQLRLDAAGRLVVDSSEEQLPANAGACQNGLKELADDFEMPMCRPLGGPCPQSAPLPLVLRATLIGGDQYRRPDAWQLACRSLHLN